MLRLLSAMLSLVIAPFGVALHSPDPTPPTDGHHGHGAEAAAHDNVTWVETMPYHPPQAYTLVIDGAHMPGERGWFLVPLTSSEPVSVDIETKHRMAYDADRAQASALIIGSTEEPWANVMPTQGSSWRDVEVNHAGRRVSCCQEVTTRIPGNTPGASGGSSGGSGAFVEPGRTLWVGLAADGWAPGSKLKIELTSWGAPLLMGAVVTGTTVEAVDLVDEARKAGSNARFASQTLVGGPGEAVRTWRPAGTGLLAIEASAQHDAWGTLAVHVPGEVPLRDERLQDEYYYGVALRAGGPFEVRLTDVHEPRPTFLVQDNEYGWLHARAFYADLSVPLRTYQMTLQPIEYEDEDW